MVTELTQNNELIKNNGDISGIPQDPEIVENLQEK